METKLENHGQIMSNDELLYFRIGTQYFKLIMQPLISGERIQKLIPWTAEAIRLDHGKEFLEKNVIKLDGFCLIPGHVDYQRIYNNFYNKYHPFKHTVIKGKEPVRTLQFLNHIFGKQLALGLDYLKILLQLPTQQLPILCLISAERATGKSLFINWLKAIYGDNMSINSNENFKSAFNSDWVTKLITALEEASLNKKEHSEMFKNMSTAKYYKVESKGVDRQEVEFFGKFILCSNNEYNFIYVDKQEVRYWVRKIPKVDSPDTELLMKLEAEIPYFLFYLLERPYSTEKRTRMWFTPKEIYTPALGRLKAANKNRVENELIHAALSIIDSMDDDNEEIRFTLSDAHAWLKSKGLRSADSSSIKRILQNEWNLKPQSNSIKYKKWQISADGAIYTAAGKGRFYTIDRAFLEKQYYSDETDAIDI